MATISDNLSTNLVSVWLTDSSGLTTDLHGSNDLTNSGVTLTSLVQGDAGDFEKSEVDTLSITDASQTSLDPGANAFTISCIVRMESQPGLDEHMRIITKDGTDTGYFIDYRDSSGTKYLRFATGNGSGFDSFQIAQTLTNATDYFLTFTKSSTTGEIFVNGSSIGTGTLSSTVSDSTGDFQLGDSNGGGDAFDGIINQVVFVNGTAWSGANISTWYNSGSGIAYSDSVNYPITAAVGAFTLTGIATNFNKALSIAAAAGSFTLSGIAATLKLGYGLVAAAGSFILTGISAIFTTSVWDNVSKNDSTFTNVSKSTDTWDNITRS